MPREVGQAEVAIVVSGTPIVTAQRQEAEVAVAAVAKRRREGSGGGVRRNGGAGGDTVMTEVSKNLHVAGSGRSGGLALLWRRNNTTKLLSFSKNHVDVEVSIADLEVWRMTGFYGFPERTMRSASWDQLRTLVSRSTLPWVVVGDFNDLLFQHEKRGGIPHPHNLLRGFGEVVEECGLAQLPMNGYQFTWERGKGTTEWMEERLDKVLAGADWTSSLPGASVTNILTRTSDHSALYLGVRDEVRGHRSLQRTFKFEMAWVYDEGCRRQEGRGAGLLDCLRYCGERLLEAQEDAFWRQRAKQHWLRGADANTKFFHKYASARKKKNFLSRLKNDSDVWVEGEGLNAVVLDYFNDIFASNNSSFSMDAFVGSVVPRVTHDQNESLLRPFDADEVKTALFSMFPDKAPGPDGMNPGFYQHYWDVVGNDVSSFVLKCLDEGTIPDGLNNTNVVLIPKKSSLEKVADLRPIALYNVVYKIMAKMVANRMKPLLGEVISDSQSAFIPNRLITDNILVAAEVGHYLNRKQCGLVGWAALKLDMAKAYDRMEWSFLRTMLVALGFHERWVNLVMLCVTTVSYNFLVNGVSAGQVTPTRGIRQGDPLSPYLFIICAEGLSLLLQQAEARGDFHGCRVARVAPLVSHIFFADDSLLFFKATMQEAGVIKHCLTDYENMSGQTVNYHKSSVCFSRNTSEADRYEVAAVLDVVQASNFGKYLGLPSFIGREKRAVFSYIEDRIKHRIGSWSKKLISQAGKEVLLKSVAQSMPTFSMSVFLIPDSVCSSIERAMNRYWWRTGCESGIHWKAWDHLCIPKKYGGLGFKDLRAFNLAMLGKQAWRFLTRPHFLVARVYKARYYPKVSFIDATLGSNPSFCWRSIMAAHEMVCTGVRRRIGDGKSTLIWGHPWLPDDPDPMVHTAMPPELSGALVSGLIDPATGTWDHAIVHDIFLQSEVQRILRIPISPQYEDSWYWKGNPGGNYTVKDGYRCFMGNFDHTPGVFDKWLHLWKIKCPAKWRTFLWRALTNTLPTTTNLIIKRVEVDPACPMCGLMHENTMHSLVLCEYSSLVWNESPIHVPSVIGHDFGAWFDGVITVLTQDNIVFVIAVLYHIWKARNSAILTPETNTQQSSMASTLMKEAPPHSPRPSQEKKPQVSASPSHGVAPTAK
ncbi:uncharacterized protein LOC116029567 [Ipomoea triloba]|uniref:uncharacterized protein LOC116029567 n=1 Tax=Ipomoea triloba TaxID=35885 RepID=UPI00125D95CD|nr:uncharacterized protein LOC116029567 [Ipomoea triloba]